MNIHFPACEQICFRAQMEATFSPIDHPQSISYIHYCILLKSDVRHVTNECYLCSINK